MHDELQRGHDQLRGGRGIGDPDLRVPVEQVPGVGDPGLFVTITPLLPTPRAVKKFANLYRLLRLSVSAQQLDDFVGGDQGGPCQAAALLLAAVVGSPHDAHDLLMTLAELPPDSDIVDAFGASDGVPAQLADLIVAIRKNTPVWSDAATYQIWATTVARYGFETYSMFTDSQTPA